MFLNRHYLFHVGRELTKNTSFMISRNVKLLSTELTQYIMYSLVGNYKLHILEFEAKPLGKRGPVLAIKREYLMRIHIFFKSYHKHIKRAVKLSRLYSKSAGRAFVCFL